MKIESKTVKRVATIEHNGIQRFSKILESESCAYYPRIAKEMNDERTGLHRV